MKNEEDKGYYCLLIAIFCGLNAYEARKVYEYGQQHPVCQKILKKKVQISRKEEQDEKGMGKRMKELRQAGYTYEAISEAYSCFPSKVKRWIQKEEKKEQEGKDAPA